MEQLSAALRALVAALEAAFGGSPSTSPASSASDPELLPKLRTLLAANDGTAEDLATHHADDLRQILGDRAARFLKLIGDFDYGEALALLGDAPSASPPDVVIDSDVFDISIMTAFYRENRGQLANALAGFMADMQSKIGKIATLVPEEKLPAVAEIAHSIKGMASTAGAHRLARLAGDLEAIAKSGDFKTAADLISLLPPTLSELQTAVTQLLPSKEPS